MYRYLRIGFGTLMIILGVVGLFLPVLQGFLFLGVGGMVLYRDIPFLPRTGRRLENRFPTVGRIKGKIRNLLSRRKRL